MSAEKGIEIVHRWYTYKGQTYEVSEVVEMKCPVTRQWLKAVAYRSSTTLNIYVRELNEFLELFEPISKGLDNLSPKATEKLENILKKISEDIHTLNIYINNSSIEKSNQIKIMNLIDRLRGNFAFPDELLIALHEPKLLRKVIIGRYITQF
jgi:succinate dehydrogenase flavin-adding protein (antitoxin of CptAB toxin-antitoxin module)